MSTINAILGYPLGWIMFACYNIFHNYGISLIVFTIITKLIMVPMSIKQQKNMVKMATLKPQMDEIQRKYKNNPQKMQEEMSMFYQRESYNPMSGCLPMLIQFPILFGLIDVIYYPLKHILRLSSTIIADATAIATGILEATGGVNRYSNEISIIKAVQMNPDSFTTLGEDFLSKVQGFDFTFFGISLGDVPTWSFSILLIIPILSVITSALVSYVSSKTSNASMGDNAQARSMNFSMMLMMPLMSGWISFSVPAGVGMYWIISNVLMAIQSLILYKIYNPTLMAEQAKAEAEAKRIQEREEKIETRKLAKQGDKEAMEKSLSSKELNRMKLAAARKRMAEKYGDEYVDDDNEKSK